MGADKGRPPEREPHDSEPQKDLWGFPIKSPSIPRMPLEQSLLCALLNGYWIRDWDFGKATDSSVFNFYIHELRHRYNFPIQSSIDHHCGRYPSGADRVRQQWWFLITQSQIDEFNRLYPEWREAFDKRAFPDGDRNATSGYAGKRPTKKMWQQYYKNLQRKLGESE